MNNIYQLQKDYIKDENGNFMGYNVFVRHIGKYESFGKIDNLAEVLWDMCNVSCWDSGWEAGTPVVRPEATFYPSEHFKGYVNDDVMIQIDGKIHRAKSSGWEVLDDIVEARYSILATSFEFNLDRILNRELIDPKRYAEAKAKYNEK